jgi:DNA polymerase iota
VQQKQIIVTCNYEARRRGLRKLQLISEAKKVCPDVVIVLGEELGRFRDASKALYKFLESFTWSGKVERLGFDEVFLDVTDIIDYNESLLNPTGLSHSFFYLKRNDPTVGFEFDCRRVAGPSFPAQETQPPPTASAADGIDLRTRLILGSHLAQHLRLCLEEEKGYTSTVGISTSKLLSKLCGNLHKPKSQTTLLDPYDPLLGDNGADPDPTTQLQSNVTTFIDSHDIGKIPGIGFKMSQRIRNHLLLKPIDSTDGRDWSATRQIVTVHEVRLFPGMGPETLDQILGGAGAERGIGGKAWALINGIDDTEVQHAKKVPSQISIEDSYIRLDTLAQVNKELRMLATSLLKRMHTDLLEDDEDPEPGRTQRWIAHPKTFRLSTRSRPPLNSDGTRVRSFNRISRSGPLPGFVFNLKDGIDSIVEKLIQETLIPMFRRLHPQPSGWNLSLMNIGVTNMVERASEDGKGGGRDIGRMFKRQEDVLKEWKIEDRDVPPDPIPTEEPHNESESLDFNLAEPSASSEAIDEIVTGGSEDTIYPTQNTIDEQAQWEDDEDDEEGQEKCYECGAVMPAFAMAAHQRFHSMEE